MNKRAFYFVFLTSIMVCPAQAVNISGIVKNGSGNGIEGVLVRLGKADISTTTGSDGSFKLKDTPTGIRRCAHPAALRGDCPFFLDDKGLYFEGARQANVTVQVYDCRGTLLFSHGNSVSSENRLMALPHFVNGVHIYRVSVNNERYTLRSVFARATNRRQAPPGNEITPAMLAKATSPIDDALIFTKTGYQLCRLAITKSDTTGIQIAMTPLVTGTVTDAEGNTYQTVKIGKQEWMSENLRSTKFNDGAAIGSVCHFYKNTTDAAAKKKWGALYEWSAANTAKLAPTGWHVSTDADWDTLENYLIANGYNYDGTIGNNIAGTTYQNKLAKSLAAKTEWMADTDDTGAIGNDLSKNNASGFSALPAGYLYYTGEFMNQNEIGFFWTATQHDASYAWYRFLWSVNRDLIRSDRVKSIGCSVRLVRNN